jgi:hypothetical protein
MVVSNELTAISGGSLVRDGKVIKIATATYINTDQEKYLSAWISIYSNLGPSATPILGKVDSHRSTTRRTGSPNQAERLAGWWIKRKQTEEN